MKYEQENNVSVLFCPNTMKVSGVQCCLDPPDFQYILFYVLQDEWMSYRFDLRVSEWSHNFYFNTTLFFSVTTILNKQHNSPRPANSQRNYKHRKNRALKPQERLLCPISFHLSLLRFLSILCCLKIALLDRLTFTCLLSLNRFDLNSVNCHHGNVQTETDTHAESWTGDAGNKCVRIHKTQPQEDVRV